MKIARWYVLWRSLGDMSYEDRCKILKWPTLSVRQDYFTLIECYKIVFGLSHLRFEDFFEFTKLSTTRSNHKYKLYTKLARFNCYKFSFFVRVIPKWNNLSSCVVEAESFNIFKSRLKSHLDIQSIYLIYLDSLFLFIYYLL